MMKIKRVGDWDYVELEDLLQLYIGGDWGKEPDFLDDAMDLAYCIRGSEIRNWKTDRGKTASLRKIKKTNIYKRQLIVDDILVEISGGGPEQPVGRTVLIDKGALSFEPAIPKICTNFLRLIRPKQEINSKFLNLYLNFFYVSGEIINFQNGSNNLRNLIFPKFLKIEIPTPPLNQQQQIVEKIEELFSELDKGIENLKTAQQQLKVYRQAVLNFVVELEANKTIDSILEKLDQGWSPKCLNQSSMNIEDWVVIKTTAIQPGYFQDNENKILPPNLIPKIQHELKQGDLLITRAGPRIRVGVCCMVKRVRPRLLNCDKVYRMRVDCKQVIPEYIEMVLNSPKYNKEIELMKTGISDSGVNLTQKSFLKIVIPVPSINEQNQIVQEIESRLSVCDKMEESITNSLQQAEALRQSILKKAFEGKLVREEIE